MARLEPKIQAVTRKFSTEVARSFLYGESGSLKAQQDFETVLLGQLLEADLKGQRAFRKELGLPSPPVVVQFKDGDTIMDFLKKAGRSVLGLNAKQKKAAVDEYAFGSPFFMVRAASQKIIDKCRDVVLKFTAFGEGVAPARVIKAVADTSIAYAETVFRTNAAKFYEKGKLRQAEASPHVWGYQFLAVKDSNVRHNHEAGHLFTAPRDHIAWASHTPPLGFQCRCTLRPIHFAEARRKGWDKQASTIPGGWYADSPGFGARF